MWLWKLKRQVGSSLSREEESWKAEDEAKREDVIAMAMAQEQEERKKEKEMDAYACMYVHICEGRV